MLSLPNRVRCFDNVAPCTGRGASYNRTIGNVGRYDLELRTCVRAWSSAIKDSAGVDNVSVRVDRREETPRNGVPDRKDVPLCVEVLSCAYLAERDERHDTDVKREER